MEKLGAKYLKQLFTGCLMWTLLFFTADTCLGQKYLVHHYNRENGLPNSIVKSASQDIEGRMWFATPDGITCYDGTTWRNYNAADGLPELEYFLLQTAPNGNIWGLPQYNTHYLFLVWFDGKSWHKTPKQPIKTETFLPVNSFQLINPGNTGSGHPILVVGTRGKGLFIFQNEKWYKLTQEQGLISNSVLGLSSLNRKLYVATNKGISVVSFNPGHDESPHIDNRLNRELKFNSPKIRGVTIRDKNRYPDDNLNESRIWLLGSTWIGYFKENSSAFTHYPLTIPFDEGEKPLKMLPDYVNGLYIGGQRGIYYFNEKSRSLESLDESSGLTQKRLNSLFIDYEKNIWIAGNRGASKITSRRFGNFYKQDGMIESEVTAVLEYGPDQFILGHSPGVSFWDGNTFETLAFAGKIGVSPQLSRVLDMKIDSKMNVWAALDAAGLIKISPDRKITWYGEPNGLSNKVSSIWPDKSGKLWIGTIDGLYLFDQYRFVKIPTPGFQHIRIRKIYKNNPDSIHVAALASGLFIYNIKSKQWRNYRVPGMKKSNRIFAMTTDSSGRLILGSANGLLIPDYKNNTLKPLDLEGLDFRYPVYFILEDQKQRLWLGTDNGVIRWDRSRARTYSKPQGLAGKETNRAAGIIDSSGRIWIGTNHGLSIYSEEFDTPLNSVPRPRIKLLPIEADGRSISIDPPQQQVHLDVNTNSLFFHFRALTFLDETAVTYSYKLEGFDDRWISEKNPRYPSVRYSNVSPGIYRFHLKAENIEGIQSRVTSSPELLLPRPYYNRWWFYLGLILLIIFILFIIIRFLTHKRYAALLEHQVEERTNQLQAIEKRYRNLFEESGDAVFISSPAGIFIDINPAGVELFGYESKDDMFNNNAALIFSNEPADCIAFTDAIEARGFVKDYETVFKSREGEDIHVKVTAAVVRDSMGHSTAYRGIIRDITGQKRLEQQLLQAQKMEAIGTLAGGIAHDFNNILGVIMGYSELVLEDIESGTLAHENSKQVLIAAKRASELVKQILAFSRQSKRERKTLHFTDIIDEALKLLRSTIPATIKIRRTITTSTSLVMADPTQLHQVIMNLCANAAYAMKDSGGIMEIRLDNIHLDADAVENFQGLLPGPFLRLSVSDTGTGIPAVVLKRIFEPYFTTKDTGQGTGMGLAVIHGIVKNHNGDIVVYSKPGKGTTFHIFLPFLPETIDTIENPEAGPEILHGNERILLIDDEAALAEMEFQALGRLGYQVTGNADPEAAIQTFKQTPENFDLVITDLTMPKITGVQIAKTVKKIKQGIPVILCSGFSASASREDLASYVDAFIMKPIIKRELVLTIRKVLDKQIVTNNN